MKKKPKHDYLCPWDLCVNGAKLAATGKCRGKPTNPECPKFEIDQFLSEINLRESKEEIRELLAKEKERYPLRKLAKKTGISLSTLWRVLNGNEMSHSTYKWLASYFNYKPNATKKSNVIKINKYRHNVVNSDSYKILDEIEIINYHIQKIEAELWWIKLLVVCTVVLLITLIVHWLI